MRNRNLALSLGMSALLFTAGAGQAEDIKADMPKAETVKADILKEGGTKIGVAEFQAGPGGVLITLSATGLTPGWHGIHLHAVGTCGDTGFLKSGGHLNHADHKKPHGLLNAEGPDFGDLPNIHVGADGTVEAQLFTSLVQLTRDLQDADGSALVIHAGPDDHQSQPIGGAGARVACAVIAAQ